MTVLDAQLELLNYFENNHLFNLKSDFIKVIPITENKEADTAILIAALQDLEKNNILTNVKDYWILNKPLQQRSQVVNLSYPTISSIVKIIQQFCLDNNIKEALVDPLNIQEKDIQSLIILLNNTTINSKKE